MNSGRVVRATKPTSVLFVATLLCTILWLDAKPTFAQDTTQVMSATLLKRLGEAVDGYRIGDTVYVVASRDFPHRVVGTFPTRTEAAFSSRDAGPRFGVFGPFEGRWDPDLGGGVLPGCTHDGNSSEWRWGLCPDGPGIPWEDIEFMNMIIQLRNGDRVVFSLPLGTDAVFLTLPAINKFVVPYYTRVLSASEAAKMMEGIKERIGSQ